MLKSCKNCIKNPIYFNSIRSNYTDFFKIGQAVFSCSLQIEMLRCFTMMYDRFIGIVVTVLGALVLVSSLGDFIMRIAFAVFGFWLINYGLRLQGKPPLIFHLSRWRNTFWY